MVIFLQALILFICKYFFNQ